MINEVKGGVGVKSQEEGAGMQGVVKEEFVGPKDLFMGRLSEATSKGSSVVAGMSSKMRFTEMMEVVVLEGKALGCHLLYTERRLAACTRCVSGSQESSADEYPFHRTRYDLFLAEPQWESIASTLYSSSPSIRSGGGLV